MKAWFDSILVRIVLIQVVTLGVIALALLAASRLLLQSEAVEFERRSLQAHAGMVAQSLYVAEDGTVRLELPDAEHDFFARGLGGLAYAVTGESGEVQQITSSSTRPRFIGKAQAGAPVYYQSSDKQKSYLGIRVPVTVDGHKLWVQITRRIRHPDMVTGDVAAYFLSRIGWYAVPIVILCVLLSILATKKMLRPIRAVSDMAGAIDPARLDIRLPTEMLPKEIVPLVHAVNCSLSRLEYGFLIQRDFTAHAAHELRTPLSILRAQIENIEAPDTVRSLREDVDAMSHIVDQLLSAAEFEGMTVSAGEVADLSQICSEVIAFMAPVALASAKDIALTGYEGAIVVNGSAAMLYQAVRNLVENALKYSPPETCIEVDLDAAGLVRVLDRGPGVPEKQREAIFRRFWRADRSKTDGAGLGLAIVSRVAEAHGGRIRVSSRSGGGAEFTLDLTAARQTALRSAKNA